jgi:hypothetical protein
MRTHDLKLAESIPLLRLPRAQPGTKKPKASLFNFGAVVLRMVANQGNDEQKNSAQREHMEQYVSFFAWRRRLSNISQCNAGIEESFGNRSGAEHMLRSANSQK